jgi:hypothetical protein
MAMRTVTLRMRRTAVTRPSQVSLLLRLSYWTFPAVIQRYLLLAHYSLPLVPSTAGSRPRCPSCWVAGSVCRQSSVRLRAPEAKHAYPCT